MVDRLARRDPVAFEYLYDRYSSALFSIVLRVIRDTGIAEEVLQDVFMKIWDRNAAYDRSKGRLFTWMLNIARNQAIDKTRSREMSRSRKTEDIDDLVHKVDRTAATETKTEGIGIKELLDRLPEDQRFVIDQLYLKGYTQSEVSEEFGIPLGTVKTRTRMGMNTLRTLLNVS